MPLPTTDTLASRGGTPVRANFLPYALPLTGEEEKQELLAALESGWITTGPRTKKLEGALAEYIGVKHVVCVDSCTAALHLALNALALQPGDEVITSPLTFASTVNTIIHAGGTPVLADVESDTLNLDPVAFARAVTPRTKAVMPVHFGGHVCEMDAIQATAAEHGLVVIEDAAHAIGAAYKGAKVGTMSDMTCYSFYATKNMTTAEGGALATNSDAYETSARLNSLHGMSRDAWKRYTSAGSWFYEIVTPGFKYNMTDLEASLGLHQLAKLDGFIAQRRELAAVFDAAFAGHPAIEIPVWREEVDHVYHLYPIRLVLDRLTCDRAQFIEELKTEGIGTTVNFIPIHYHPYYRDRLGLAPGALPVAEAAYERLISLPLYPKMTPADAADVIAAVNKVAAAYTR
jgi:dTDP-4-amino-4,6-dideoxygalactose transaminase